MPCTGEQLWNVRPHRRAQSPTNWTNCQGNNNHQRTGRGVVLGCIAASGIEAGGSRLCRVVATDFSMKRLARNARNPEESSSPTSYGGQAAIQRRGWWSMYCSRFQVSSTFATSVAALTRDGDVGICGRLAAIIANTWLYAYIILYVCFTIQALFWHQNLNVVHRI